MQHLAPLLLGIEVLDYLTLHSAHADQHGWSHFPTPAYYWFTCTITVFDMLVLIHAKSRTRSQYETSRNRQNELVKRRSKFSIKLGTLDMCDKQHRLLSPHHGLLYYYQRAN